MDITHRAHHCSDRSPYDRRATHILRDDPQANTPVTTGRRLIHQHHPPGESISGGDLFFLVVLPKNQKAPLKSTQNPLRSPHLNSYPVCDTLPAAWPGNNCNTPEASAADQGPGYLVRHHCNTKRLTKSHTGLHNRYYATQTL